MRKVTALFLTVVLLLSAVFIYTFISLTDEADNVTITASTETGDKSIAQKVSLDFGYNVNNRLLWASKLSFGEENKVETNFMFSKNYIDRESDPGNEITFYSVSGYTSSGENTDYKNGTEFTGLDIAYKALYDRAILGTETEDIVRFKDYQEFYPIEGQIRAKDFLLSFGNSYLFNQSDEDTAASEYLSSFFRIPVLDDEWVKISIFVDSNGDVGSKSFGSTNSGGDSFGFYTSCAEDEKGIYVVFSNRTSNGNCIDTSLIPGDYGIYFFPFTEDGIDLKGIKNTYPVDPETELIDISVNADKTALHLISRENNCLYLNVIDTDTMVCRQKLLLRKGLLDSADQVDEHLLETEEDYLIYHVYDDHYNVSVVEIDEEGHYTLAAEIEDHLNVAGYGPCKWDGENLYFACMKTDYGTFTGTTGTVYFGIVNKDGVVFEGDYKMSLNTGEAINYMSSYYANKENQSLKINFIG